MSPPDEAQHWLKRACEHGHTPAMLNYSDFMLQRDPVEALAWLYTGAALSGDDAPRHRAAALAKEMTAKEIDGAQKAGRAQLKSIQSKARAR